MTENEVVEYMITWLESKNAEVKSYCLGTQRGDDIAAVLEDGTNLFIECKGAISRYGNNLDCWKNSAYALFGAVKEVEEFRPNDIHGIAVPNNAEYKDILGGLKEFLNEKKIKLYWVERDGSVVENET